MNIHNQKGSGLIEVMVALVILGSGLLGVLSMQVANLVSNRQSHYAAEALWLANDLTDRIYAYDDVDSNSDNDDFHNFDTSVSVSDPGCRYSGCTGAAKLQFAKWEWKQTFLSRLPSGRGQVFFDSANQLYTLKIMWDNHNTGASGTNCSSDTEVDLTCFLMEVPL